MKKKISILLTSLVLFNSCASDKEKKEPTDELTKPNVLLLYMDDLRPEMNCYDNPAIKTPNIDAFANQSVKFTEAYCNVAVCGASRASMLTGILPQKGFYIDYNTRVDQEKPELVSFPKLLKQNGYTTISNGKIYHHLDDNWNDWDEVWRPYAFDKNDKNLKPIDYWQSLWKDFQLADNIVDYKTTGKGPAYESANVHDSVYIDGLLTEKVIRDLKKLKNSKEPFFLTAGFISNHLPFNAPQKYWDLYPEESIKQPYNNFIPKNAPEISISNSGELKQYSEIPTEGYVSDETAKKLIHGYYATVSYVDALIGKILTSLKEEGLHENTIVILVADHGYNLQEHTQWCKYTNHRTSMKVPLIISVPGLNKGTNTNSLVELVDIYPTVVELCNLPQPKHDLSGKSLVPLLNNTEFEEKKHILTKNGNGFSIKTSKYCYTEYINLETYETIAYMLFDHEKDIDENTNVADNPEYAHVVKELKNILHTDYKENIMGKEYVR